MGSMFIKTKDEHTATELIGAGLQLMCMNDEWWVFVDAPNFELTDEQRRNVIRTPLIYM